MKRARQAHQKEDRKQAILKAGEELLAKTPWAEIRMDAIARRAKLAKGTLYLYFKTKEELFLALAERELEAWFALFVKGLEATPVSGGKASQAEGFAQTIADSLSERASLLKLLALLHTVLEENIPEAKAREFKHWLKARLARGGEMLEARFGLPIGQGAQLLLTVHAVAIGIWQMAYPSPVVSRVIHDPKEPELKIFVIDFQSTFSNALRSIVGGAFTPRSTS